MSDHYQIANNASGTNHEVKILNDIANFLQAAFLATEKNGNIVDANYRVVINKQSCLSQFLLTIFFRSIMSPIQ